MKSKRNRSSKPLLSLPSPLIVAAVGIICITYVQLSQSAAITVQDIKSSNKSDPPVHQSKGSTAKPNKPRVEVHVQVGRMKASDIKACISKAFCEVNSVSKMPNYAVNQEFFDLMNQIHAMSNEEVDSGSASAEYDDNDDDDDDDVSSEESSSERLRGYPPRGMPPPPGYRLGKNLKDGQNETLSLTSTNTTLTESQSGDKKKIKKTDKKKLKLGQKVLKKFANGTLVTFQKHRRSRLETAEEKAEKAEKKAYLSRKQREMGQVGDLAALIRISSDIGLTIRNYKKCRSLFTKCTMSHDQVMDLFNQTLMAVASPNTSSPEPEQSAPPVPTTQRAKVTTAALEVMSSPTTLKSQLETKRPAMIFKSTSAPIVITTSAAPASTISADDGNRSSKSRHEFSDEEDVEYLTETELNQPVYALFVNDAPEDTVKTAEEINVQETFKKYANTFPSETLIQADIPSLRKSGNKGKSLKKHGSSSRSSKSKQIAKRRQTSSEEDDDDDDEDEEDDDAGSMSMEAQPSKINFRVDPYHGYEGNGKHSVESSDPYHGYRGNGEHGAESSEPFSVPKDSGELPPLVKKQKPKQKEAEEEEDDEDDSEESGEAEADEPKKAPKSKSKLQAKKKSGKPSKPAPVEEEDSSEEDEVEVAEDDPQVHPPWTPVYQMYMTEKQKQGHKKKQKGPYKGGEGPYPDIAIHHGSSHSSTSKKPWGGSSSSLEVGPPSSHESPYGDLPYHHGHYGNGPLPSSQEAGGPGEQKPGFFQSIMSWFTGNKNPNGDPSSGQLQDDPYAAHAYGQHPYGMQPGSAELQQDELPEHDISATGAPWPAQPDPAGLGHFGRNPQYRIRNPDSSEEDDDLEEVLVEEPMVSKRQKKNKRRYRGRSDSIITSSPKKKQPVKKSTSNGGPPPPVVITPKEKQQVVGVYEPNHSYDKLMQADGGSAPGRRKVAHSDKENKRTKKAAVKNQQKKSKKQKQRGQSHRTSRESTEDDDEAFSSEELYNQQVAKLKAGNQQVMLGGNSNSNHQKLGNKPSKNGESFPTYFESMFGSAEHKDQFQNKGKDDGSLLYGFESLSSHLSPTPLDLSVVANKKKTSSYKVNKNKKKNKKENETPVRFNNKEVVESSEEEEKKKK